MATKTEDLLKPYRLRKLDPAAGVKPLDFGGGAVTGSVNADGRIIAINTYDTHYGYVTLTSAAPFPEADRYNSERVRAYRRALVDQEGFGLAFKQPIAAREAYLIEDAVPMIRLTLADGLVATVITFAPDQPSSKDVLQIWTFSMPGQHAQLTGRMWLQRSAYTQLTEGGPAEMPATTTAPLKQTRELTPIGVTNPAMQWNVVISTGANLVQNDDGSVSFGASLVRSDTGDYIYPQIVPQGLPMPGFGLTTPDETVPPTDESVFYFSYQRGKALRHVTLAHARQMLLDVLDNWRNRWHGWAYRQGHSVADLALRRALVYGTHCCIRLDEEAVCIITDHMLLPLAWNRDAYYVARGLLHWEKDLHVMVRGYLVWLFDRTERVRTPHGPAWGRAYLANGQVKDRGFQLDQQLYPLLALAEYVATTGDELTLQNHQQAVIDVLAMLRAMQARHAMLYPTEETPADDPIPLPYHLSSHILMWHTLHTLAAVAGTMLVPFDLRDWADALRQAIDDHFITALPSGEVVYAYATDAAGNYHLYHDANDMPLALAPAWGLVTADHAVWRNTMAFAFSPQNKACPQPGYLGSVHTPGAWPLGDAQAMLLARATGDKTAEGAIRQRLAQMAQWDGALPEAYDVHTSSVISRHWFAWPNAMLAYLDLTPKSAAPLPAPPPLAAPAHITARRTKPMNFGFIATRLAGVDGVSLETKKMVQVLEEMGHQCFYIAGEFDGKAKPGWLVPSMHFYDPVARRIHDEIFLSPEPSLRTFRRIYGIADSIRAELMAFIDEFKIDVIVPQNASTIPMNISLGVAIAETIKRLRIRTICHHHDFYWERDRFINNRIQDILNDAFPPSLEPIRHLTINTVMQRRLKAFRGIEATYLPNVFDFENPPGPPDEYAMSFRAELGLSDEDLIVLQPTRLVRRKAIEKAIELVRKLDDPRLILLITGYEGDEPGEYGSWLMEEARRAGIRYKFIGEYVGSERGERDGHLVFDLWDVYPHAHIVTYPSVYEGFGNALIETCYFRKPFVVHTYAAYLSDIKPTGIRAVEFSYDITAETLDQVRQIIDDEALREQMVAHNYRVCLEHFSFQVLRNTMKQVLASL